LDTIYSLHSLLFQRLVLSNYSAGPCHFREDLH